MAELKQNEVLDNDDFREVIDLDGAQHEIIGELEHEGVVYLALIPYNEEEEEDDEKEAEFTILKEVEEGDEVFLATVDEDDMYEKIGAKFLKMFEDEGD